MSKGHSFLASPSATIRELERWGLHTKKSLGQHFLVDNNVIERICELSGVCEGQTVLEVGPGIGTLTVALIGMGAKVVAIEMDRDLIPVVTENATKAANGGTVDGTAAGGASANGAANGGAAGDSDRDTNRAANFFAIANMDALDLDSQKLSELCSQIGAAGVDKLVANLPYSVAGSIVLNVLMSLPQVQSLCVMVQKELADRMIAKPGSRDYGAYSVKVSLLAKAIGSFKVSPGSFLPPPRVDSAVIRLDRRLDFVDPDILQAACTMADAAFFQRRKTIRNSISAWMSSHAYEQSKVDILLDKANIDPARRGETLSSDEFCELARVWLYNVLSENRR